MRRRLVSLAALAMWATRLPAQQTDSLSLPHAEFLERAYLFKNLPSAKTGELFQAFLPVHIPLWQTLQGAYDEVLPDKWSWHSAKPFTFSMVVDLRMTMEDSRPVRTPSYMPKFTWTYYKVRAIAKVDTSIAHPTNTDSVRAAVKGVHMWAFPIVPYGHYSNGQDGCLFSFQSRDTVINANGKQETVCTNPAAGPPPIVDAVINRRDGSFSSHYMQFGAFYRRITLDDVLGPGVSRAAKSYWSVGGHVRLYQPYYEVPGGMSEELRALYGPTRVRLLAHRVRQVDGRGGPGLYRIEGFVEGLLGARHEELEPLRFSVELARTFDKRSGWGVFARAYAGQDDYNLGFLRNLRVAQVGVTASTERMPTFHR